MTANPTDLLFVGSYSSENEPGIHVFAIDWTTGEKIPYGSFAGIANPSFLTIHPNGEWLYAVSETSLENDGVFGSVHSFKIQHGRQNLSLQPINLQSTEGNWPCHVEIDASGRWLIASNYGTGNAALYPILPEGALGEMKSFLQHEGQGPNKARQEGPHAHSATFTPDNRFVIIADLGIDQLVIYKFDAETGSILRHAEVQSLPGAGPRQLAFHPGGKFLMVANELNSSVTVYAYHAENCTLDALQTLDTLPTDSPESIVADIHLSPSGQHVYVSNRGHDSLAIFAFDEEAGRLSEVANQETYGKIPRNFTLDISGTFLIAANQDSNNIVVFHVNHTSGQLNFVEEIAGIPKPVCLKMISLK